MICTDHRCTDGITWCVGCNGHGVLRPGGKKYRQNGAGNITAAAKVHTDCNGTGLARCGCTELHPAELAVFTPPRQETAA